MGASSALRDVRNVVRDFGQTITIINPPSIVTNDYGDIISRETSNVFNPKAFPITFSPSDKDLQKAGLTIKVDVIVYLSKLEMETIGLLFEDIEADQSELKIRGRQYLVKQTNEASQYADEFLYYTVGGKRL